MATYAYLGLCLYFLFFWILFFAFRPDLRFRMIAPSIGGALAGPISEIWHFQDYWLPPSTAGIGVHSFEDVLVGFAVAGVSVVLVRVVLGLGIKKTAKPIGSLFLIPSVILFILITLLIGSTWLGFNSILVSGGAFTFIAAVLLALRPDLLRLSLLSGCFLTLLAIPIYLVLFVALVPDWWEHAWIVKDPLLRSLTVLGIPLTEFFWYFTWGMMAGIVFDVREGTVEERS